MRYQREAKVYYDEKWAQFGVDEFWTTGGCPESFPLSHIFHYPRTFDMKSLKIIGNIYENPELLEKK